MSEAEGKVSLIASEGATVEGATTTATPPPEGTSPAPTPEAAPAAPAEPKPALAAQPAPLTAEAIKFPEGVEVDAPMRDALLGIMNNAELDSAKRAQALVDLHLKSVEQASEKASQYYHELRDKWVGEAKAEFGDNLNPTLGNIAKLIDEYGGNAEQRAAIRDTFTLTGAGDNPAIVRLFANIAKQLVVEGRPIGGTPAGSVRLPEEILFGKAN